MFCFKHGIDPKALIKSIANGMAYDEPRDEKAMLFFMLVHPEHKKNQKTSQIDSAF